MSNFKIYVKDSKTINLSQSLNDEIINLRNDLEDLQNTFSGVDFDNLDIDDLHEMLSVIDNDIIPITNQVSIGTTDNPLNVISSNTLQVGNSIITTNNNGGIDLPLNTTLGNAPIGTDTTELFFPLTDRIVTESSDIIFDNNFHTLFTSGVDGYVYNGDNDVFKISLNIRYESNSTNPYEIVNYRIDINNVQRFNRRYGFDMQNRIKDDFITNIDSGDTIRFILHSVLNVSSTSIKILSESFIAVNALNMHVNLNN